MPSRLFGLRCACALVWLILGGTLSSAEPQRLTSFSGGRALAFARHAVSFGERPSGSEANTRQREWILAELKSSGGEITQDSFIAQTPSGGIPMVNILVKFPGSSGKAIAVTGHYDTKRIPMVHFVGANDGGSSTGFLLEMAHCLPRFKHEDDLYLVFFDGEEALGEWTETDSRYGSRHLVDRWAAEGILPKLKALINVDMIGDKELDISNDSNSSASLRASVRSIAERLKYGKYFRSEAGAIDDDHKPFGDAGVNVIDIIDLDYGPNGSYWHTAQDNFDKLSAHSLQVAGDVVIELLKELGR